MVVKDSGENESSVSGDGGVDGDTDGDSQCDDDGYDGDK